MRTTSVPSSRIRRVTPPVIEPLLVRTVRCCREWKVSVLAPMQRCGLCRQVPR